MVVQEIDPIVKTVYHLGNSVYGSLDTLEYFLRLAGKKIPEEDAQHFRRKQALLGARHALTEAHIQNRLISDHPGDSHNAGRENLLGFLAIKAKRLRRFARELRPSR